jgi:hypothetical protein
MLQFELKQLSVLELKSFLILFLSPVNDFTKLENSGFLRPVDPVSLILTTLLIYLYI